MRFSRKALTGNEILEFSTLQNSIVISTAIAESSMVEMLLFLPATCPLGSPIHQLLKPRICKVWDTYKRGETCVPYTITCRHPIRTSLWRAKAAPQFADSLIGVTLYKNLAADRDDWGTPRSFLVGLVMDAVQGRGTSLFFLDSSNFRHNYKLWMIPIRRW